MPAAPPSLTRRQLLRRLGLATGAVAGLGLVRALDATAQPRRPLRVVIVGAGLAGLCAAYELEKRGHHCVILEAERRHVGGRVRTLRFDDGLYGEAGAMRVPAGHVLTRHYLSALGVPLRPFVQSNPDAFAYARGQRVRMRDAASLGRFYALRPEEQGLSPDALWARSVGSVLAGLEAPERADLMVAPPATKAIRRWDQRSLEQLAAKTGLSPDAIELMAVVTGTETLLPSAATEHLREELEGVWAQGFEEVVGGTDRFPAAFVARLRSKPRMGCAVTRLEQDPRAGTAAAIYVEDGAPRREEGDFLLCTMPFPVLSRIPVSPPLSDGKARAIRVLNYDSSTKVLGVARRRFWEADDGIFGGGTYTDLPSGVTYYPSDNATARDPGVSRGPGVFLASYTWGQAARRLASVPHAERARVVVEALGRVHPQLRDPAALRRTASWSWDQHRWAGGAFAWFLPGQQTALHADVVRPEGRIWFAGEHCSLAHTWMQGALESALVAVRGMVGEGR